MPVPRPENFCVTRTSFTRIACSTLLAGALFGSAALPADAAVTAGSRTPTSAPAHVKAKTVTHRRGVTRVVKRARKKTSRKVARAHLTTFENELLTDINNARHKAGVGSLAAAPGTTDVARRWTLSLVQADALSHNPDLVTDAQNAGSNDWTWLGENVGTGPANDEADLFAAYMASPHHRDNILDPRARYIGIGVIQVTDANGNQVAYNTCDFTDAYSKTYGADKTPELRAVTTVDRATAEISG